MLQGYYYHIYNRGNNKELIFREESNYYYFLKRFYNFLNKYVKVYAYCLMPEHFHFLIKVRVLSESATIKSDTYVSKLTPIEKAFRDFFISYSKAFNKRYSRTGSLFQYKFKRKLINNESYLIRIIPYIHGNPVRKKLCNELKEWKFSSYNSIISEKKTNIKRKEVLNLFGGLNNFAEYHKYYSTLLEDRKLLF